MFHFEKQQMFVVEESAQREAVKVEFWWKFLAKY
jgi:hypothetical protein